MRASTVVILGVLLFLLAGLVLSKPAAAAEVQRVDFGARSADQSWQVVGCVGCSEAEFDKLVAKLLRRVVVCVDCSEAEFDKLVAKLLRRVVDHTSYLEINSETRTEQTTHGRR